MSLRLTTLEQASLMYIPSAFAELNREKLFDFIEQHSFGLLLSQHDGEPFGSHLPFLLDRWTDPQGRLIGHMARANPQWQQSDGAGVLVVFSGPHTYVSPRWYNDSNVVPTWNYVSVHAYGTMHTIHDRAGVLRIVEQTVDRYESTQAARWTFDSSTEFAEKLASQIVGFEIPLSRVEGKWKLSQNHPIDRRSAVISALLESGDSHAHEVARLMQISGDAAPDDG